MLASLALAISEALQVGWEALVSKCGWEKEVLAAYPDAMPQLQPQLCSHHLRICLPATCCTSLSRMVLESFQAGDLVFVCRSEMP